MKKSNQILEYKTFTDSDVCTSSAGCSQSFIDWRRTQTANNIKNLLLVFEIKKSDSLTNLLRFLEKNSGHLNGSAGIIFHKTDLSLHFQQVVDVLRFENNVILGLEDCYLDIQEIHTLNEKKLTLYIAFTEVSLSQEQRALISNTVNDSPSLSVKFFLDDSREKISPMQEKSQKELPSTSSYEALRSFKNNIEKKLRNVVLSKTLKTENFALWLWKAIVDGDTKKSGIKTQEIPMNLARSDKKIYHRLKNYRSKEKENLFIQHLILNPGDMTNVSYIGGLNALEQTVDFSKNLSSVFGYSFQSLLAVFIALGVSSTDMLGMFLHQIYPRLWVERVEQPSNIFSILGCLIGDESRIDREIFGRFSNAAKENVSENLLSLADLDKWLRNKIDKISGYKHTTFGDLQKLCQRSPSQYKTLRVSLTNIRTNELITIDSNDEKYRDYIISDAIIAACSIPIVYKFHTLTIRITYLDGAAGYHEAPNYPCIAVTQPIDFSLKEDKTDRCLAFDFFEDTQFLTVANRGPKEMSQYIVKKYIKFLLGNQSFKENSIGTLEPTSISLYNAGFTRVKKDLENLFSVSISEQNTYLEEKILHNFIIEANSFDNIQFQQLMKDLSDLSENYKDRDDETFLLTQIKSCIRHIHQQIKPLIGHDLSSNFLASLRNVFSALVKKRKFLKRIHEEIISGGVIEIINDYYFTKSNCYQFYKFIADLFYSLNTIDTDVFSAYYAHYALIFISEEDLLQKQEILVFINSIEIRFVQHITQNDLKEYQTKSKYFYDELKEVRKQTTNRNNFNRAMLDFIKEVADWAATTTTQRFKKFPTNFCLVGLGSIAFGYMSLYSDIDIALLIDDASEEATVSEHRYHPAYQVFLNLFSSMFAIIGETVITDHTNKIRAGTHVDEGDFISLRPRKHQFYSLPRGTQPNITEKNPDGIYFFYQKNDLYALKKQSGTPQEQTKINGLDLTGKLQKTVNQSDEITLNTQEAIDVLSQFEDYEDGMMFFSPEYMSKRWSPLKKIANQQYHAIHHTTSLYQYKKDQPDLSIKYNNLLTLAWNNVKNDYVQSSFNLLLNNYPIHDLTSLQLNVSNEHKKKSTLDIKHSLYRPLNLWITNVSLLLGEPTPSYTVFFERLKQLDCNPLLVQDIEDLLETLWKKRIEYSRDKKMFLDNGKWLVSLEELPAEDIEYFLYAAQTLLFPLIYSYEYFEKSITFFDFKNHLFDIQLQQTEEILEQVRKNQNLPPHDKEEIEERLEKNLKKSMDRYGLSISFFEKNSEVTEPENSINRDQHSSSLTLIERVCSFFFRNNLARVYATSEEDHPETPSKK